jgi:hypothetical protein
MPIITKSSPIAKDAPITFTLDKVALAALPVVVADAWFADTANWKKVILTYGSTLGNEMIAVSFDATILTPTGSFLAVSPARDVFDIISITIQDFNQGTLRVPTSSLNQAEFVVDFNAAPVSLWDVFLAPTIATAGNGELHREGGANGDVDNTAYHGNLVTGDFVFSGEIPTFSVGTSLFIGYRRTVPQAGAGYNSILNSALSIGNNTGFVQVETLNGIGGTATDVGMVALYSPTTFTFSISRVSGVITATFNNVIRFTDNNSDPIYLLTSLPNLSGLMNSASLIVSPVVPVLFEQLVNNSGYFGGLNENIVIGQNFTYTNPLSVSKVELLLKKADGFPLSEPSEYKMRIRKTSDNSLLAESTNSMLQSQLTSTFDFVEFNFDVTSISSDWYFELYAVANIWSQMARYSVGLQMPVGNGQATFNGLVTDANLTYKVHGTPYPSAFFLRDYANPSSPESFESFFASSISGGKLVFDPLAGGAEYTANPSGVEFTQGVQYRYRIYVSSTSEVPPSLSFQLGETDGEAHSFSGAQISAALGSFLEYSFTATVIQVIHNPFIRLIKNGGNDGLSIDKIELIVV